MTVETDGTVTPKDAVDEDPERLAVVQRKLRLTLKSIYVGIMGGGRIAAGIRCEGN